MPKHPPASRSLPLHAWPPSDRAAWECACRPGKRLLPGGAASHLAIVTRDDLARRYGQLLNHLALAGRLDTNAAAGEHVTPETISAFVAELQGRVRSVTVAQSVRKVCRMLTLIAPQRDCSWLAGMASDLALLAQPMDKFPRVVTAERLVEAGLTLAEEAEVDTSKPIIERALLARTGLMIAMLALAPIRLKNFANLRIGQSFLRHGDTWWIVLKHTKTERLDERPLPNYLNELIARYLEIYLPVLAGNRGEDCGTENGAKPLLRGCSSYNRGKESLALDLRPLWVSRRRAALSAGQVARSITNSTLATIGTAVSPHLFRASAATTAALHAADMPFLPAALLQHWDRSVTDEHYNRSNALSVAVQYADLIATLRQKVHSKQP